MRTERVRTMESLVRKHVPQAWLHLIAHEIWYLLRLVSTSLLDCKVAVLWLLTVLGYVSRRLELDK